MQFSHLDLVDGEFPVFLVVLSSEKKQYVMKSFYIKLLCRFASLKTQKSFRWAGCYNPLLSRSNSDICRPALDIVTLESATEEGFPFKKLSSLLLSWLLFFILKIVSGTSLMAQRLRFLTPNAEGPGSIPGHRTRSRMSQLKDSACLN